jgi:peptide/nickel transport system substrate-binding protein
LWVATDGAGAAAHRGGVLYALASGTWYPNGPDVSAFDPGSAYTAPLWRVLVMTSDGLVAYRHAGGVAGNELVPDLAVSLPAPTDGGLTYTFHIRSGIRYSNGIPLRASDFLRGLQRAFKVGGGPVPYYTPIIGGQQCFQHPPSCDLSRGIVADDATNTLTFHLTTPDPDLLNQLTLPASYPVPPGTPVRLRARWIPGTGAYEISSYKPAAPNNPRAHGLLVLTRNPYFHQWSAAAQPAGFPDRIVVRTNYSPAQQVTAVQQGRADVAWDGPPLGEVSSLSQNYPSLLHTALRPETTWMWLNVRSPPFNSVLARRAVDYALDRGAIAQASIHPYDHGRPTCQLLPPDYPGYVRYCPYTIDPAASQRWLAPDVAKAQALVRESGTLGDRVTLIWPSHEGPRPGKLIAAALRQIGYRVRLIELADSQYPGPPGVARFNARFQAGLGNWAADYVATSNFFVPLVECSDIMGLELNAGGFCDHSLDASVARALSDQALRPGLALQEWAAIDRRVSDEAIVVPISNQVGSDLVSRRVGNYQYNPQWGMLVDQLWVR